MPDFSLTLFGLDNLHERKFGVGQLALHNILVFREDCGEAYVLHHLVLQGNVLSDQSLLVCFHLRLTTLFALLVTEPHSRGVDCARLSHFGFHRAVLRQLVRLVQVARRLLVLVLRGRRDVEQVSALLELTGHWDGFLRLSRALLLSKGLLTQIGRGGQRFG